MCVCVLFNVMKLDYEVKSDRTEMSIYDKMEGKKARKKEICRVRLSKHTCPQNWNIVKE